MGGFDGNGTYNRFFNWAQDAANGIDINASRMDTEDTGFAGGLSTCLTKDGQGKMQTDFLPQGDNTLNLGSPSLRWASLNGNPLKLFVPLSSHKTAPLGRTAASVVPDPDLTLTIPGAGSYTYEMVLDVWGSGASNQGALFSADFSGSQTSGFARLMYGAGTNVGLSVGANGVFIVTDVLALVSTQSIMVMSGTFTATSSGTFNLGWGTRTATGSATNLGAGSYMTVRQIA